MKRKIFTFRFLSHKVSVPAIAVLVSFAVAAMPSFAQGPSQTRLFTSPNPSSTGQSVMLRAEVDGGGGAPPSGSMVFSVGGTTLGTVPLRAPGAGQATIGAGNGHSCALTNTGQVRCWGENRYGQLGNGTTTSHFTPVSVSGLASGAIAIAVGGTHACALSGAGAVRCWGSNFGGELGDGTTTSRTTPVAVSGLAGSVVAISAGNGYTCALTRIGAVKCWGSNARGELGDGTTISRSVPVAVSGLVRGIVAITTGSSHACALTSAGAVNCWGDNFYGQLGDGTKTQRLTPVSVGGLAGGAAIAAGGSHTCALIGAGAAKCWGGNFYGQLGDGTTIERLLPVAVSGLSSGVAAIEAGSSHSCGLTSAGAIKCWGSNVDGRLGDGTEANRLAPVAVSGLGSGAVAVALGASYSCATRNTGELQCWGDNNAGQLGDGKAGYSLTPVSVQTLSSGIAAIAAGGYHGCAQSGGAVNCWGDNFYGQLGDGTTTRRLAPVAVSGLTSGVTAIAPGRAQTCALKLSGVRCWGNNSYGQLGDGTTIQRLQPVSVSGLSNGVVAISAGNLHSCAVTGGGGAKCWGRNFQGQLGDGTAVDQARPVFVSGLTSGIVAISAGGNHTCAIRGSAVLCWGLNDHGQLGDGNTHVSWPLPADAVGLQSGVIAVATGALHSCALSRSGAVKCWGSNFYGQLGDGTTTDRRVPVVVSGLSRGVVAIATGGNHTCALTNAGAVKCWGANADGQLGDGTATERLKPVAVSGLASGVVSITAGQIHTCARTSGGAVKCWGDNGYGQFGNGVPSFRVTPVVTRSFFALLRSAARKLTSTLGNGVQTLRATYPGSTSYLGSFGETRHTVQ